MSLLVGLPILIPLATAAIGFAAWRHPRIQKAAAVAGPIGLLTLGGLLVTRVVDGDVLVLEVGGWPAPFGIVLVGDAFSSLMVTLAGLMGLVAVAYALGSVGAEPTSHGFYPLTQVLLAGVCGAFVTGDLFDLYVWFEVLLIASFVLVVLEGEREQLEGGFKYVVLSLLGSMFFLTALGLVYGTAGTLNMADLAGKLEMLPATTVLPVALLLFLAFGLKAGVFPLAFWLPATYPAPPVAVSALLAGLLTKVGVYAFFRVFTVVLPTDLPLVGLVLGAVTVLSMVVGVLGAVAQQEIRRILAFHSISQVGYMLMGLVIGTPLALAAGIVFAIHHSVVKGGLFLVSGLVERAGGSTQLRDLGGLSDTHPRLAGLFLVLALSLAGLPPLSGFWAKFGLIWAGLEAHAYVLVATALGVSLLTLLSMTKIFGKAFWRPAESRTTTADTAGILVASVVLLAGLAVLLGLAVEPLFALAETAGRQLSDPTPYLEAVLEGST